jgi:uncharacterized protein
MPTLHPPRLPLRHLLGAAVALAAAARPGAAQTVPPDLVPRSPAPASAIADGGPVLSAPAHAALDAHIAEVRRGTGGDVAVAVVRDLRGRAPSDVGLAIYRAWKVGAVDTIGSPRRDLGALLLIVPKELAPSGRGECWITTGLGAEGTLTDARAGHICRDAVIPALRRRDHAAAIEAGVDEIGQAFAEAVEASADREDEAAGEGDPPADTATAVATSIAGPEAPSSRWPSLLIRLLGGTGVLAAGWGIVAAVRRRRPRQCPAGHGAMRRLDETADDAALAPGQQFEERIGSVDYDVWVCDRCPERVVIPYRSWLYGRAACAACGVRAIHVRTRTVHAATTSSTGLREVRTSCLYCKRCEITHRTIPCVSESSGSSSSSSSSSGGFGGSGASAGGGGGSSY